MLKWRTINYKMKAPSAAARREPAKLYWKKAKGKRRDNRERERKRKREKEKGSFICTYLHSICAVCCLSATGIGLDWIAASAIQTLEASMWVGLSRSCFKLKLHFPVPPTTPLPSPRASGRLHFSLRVVVPFFFCFRPSSRGRRFFAGYSTKVQEASRTRLPVIP